MEHTMKVIQNELFTQFVAQIPTQLIFASLINYMDIYTMYADGKQEKFREGMACKSVDDAMRKADMDKFADQIQNEFNNIHAKQK